MYFVGDKDVFDQCGGFEWFPMFDVASIDEGLCFIIFPLCCGAGACSSRGGGCDFWVRNN